MRVVYTNGMVITKTQNFRFGPVHQRKLNKMARSRGYDRTAMLRMLIDEGFELWERAEIQRKAAIKKVEAK